MIKFSREEFLELYKALPENLKQALEADRTVNTTERLCEEKDLNAEQCSALVDTIGEVLMGLLPPSEFQKELERLGIGKETSEEIASTADRFIFYPVKESLERIYEEKIEIEGIPFQREEKEKREPKEPGKKDKYREEID